MANEETLRSDRRSLVFHRQTVVKSGEKNVDDGVRFGNAFPRNMAGIFRSSTVKRGKGEGGGWKNERNSRNRLLAQRKPRAMFTKRLIGLQRLLP